MLCLDPDPGHGGDSGRDRVVKVRGRREGYGLARTCAMGAWKSIGAYFLISSSAQENGYEFVLNFLTDWAKPILPLSPSFATW